MSSHRRTIPSHRLALALAPVAMVVLVAATHQAPRADLHITGRVVDDLSGSPLASARISVRELNVGTLTDRDGRYTLDVPRGSFPPGGAHLSVTLIGYQTRDALVRPPAAAQGDTITADFRLQVAAFALQEVVVDGARSGGEASPTIAATFSDPGAPMRADAASAYAPAVRSNELRWRQGPGWNREQYAHIEENAFQSVLDHPLSTFSIDVDRASYSNVRRFLLREQRLPPVDAVQIEELINYFSYDYARPRGDDPVAVTTEVGAAPWAPRHRLLRIGLASRPIATEEMPPANLVFLLDVSGSMASPDKLPLVQSSMRLLVDQMRPEDHVAIVVYAGAAGLVLEPTSGAHKERILAAIERLRAGGSTAGGEGLRLAYRVARKHFRRDGNNRVILATDGDFNVGESSDGAMIRLVEERRAEGTFLTVLGFGTGNLQSEKMQGIAQHGNGNYAYIDGLQEARKVLVREMGGTLLTVAKDVKVQIEFNPARVQSYRLLGYENRLLAAEDFNDDRKDAGEMGAGHTVTALYEIVPVGAESDVDPGQVDPLRYNSPTRTVDPSSGEELAFVKIRYKQPAGTESELIQHAIRDRGGQVSDDFNFAAAVAGFGMLLRGSEYRGAISAAQILALAEDGLGEDPDGYRQGFLELVDAYCGLTGEHVGEGRRR